MMNKLTIGILISSATMFATLLTLDFNQFFVTPLSPYGANHWIPELIAMFLIGRWLIQSEMKKPLILSIIGCVFIYPLLTYSLMNKTQFGLGTSSIFTAVLLSGIWSALKKEREVT